jgi:hypothetical protein
MPTRFSGSTAARRTISPARSPRAARTARPRSPCIAIINAIRAPGLLDPLARPPGEAQPRAGAQRASGAGIAPMGCGNPAPAAGASSRSGRRGRGGRGGAPARGSRAAVSAAGLRDGAGAGGAGPGSSGEERAAKVGEDRAPGDRILHGGDDPQPAATAGTGPDVEVEGRHFILHLLPVIDGFTGGRGEHRRAPAGSDERLLARGRVEPPTVARTRRARARASRGWAPPRREA